MNVFVCSPSVGRHPALRLALGAAIVLGYYSFPVISSGGEPGIAENKAPLDRIVEAAGRSARRFENVTLVGHCRITNSPDGKEPTEDVFWFRLLRLGENISAEKLDSLGDEPIAAEPQSGPGCTDEILKRFRLRSVVSKSDRYDVLLRRSGDGGKMNVDRINHDPSGPSRGKFIFAAHAVMPALEASYANYHVPVASVLSYEGCRVALLAPPHQGDIRLSYQCIPSYAPEGFIQTIGKGSARLGSGEIVCRESDGWAVSSHSMNMRYDGSEKVSLSIVETVRYTTGGGPESGVVPAQVVQRRRIAGTGSDVKVVISVAAIEFGTRKESDFYLSAYGLPEPAGDGISHTALWIPGGGFLLSLFGCLCLLAAAFLRWKLSANDSYSATSRISR